MSKYFEKFPAILYDVEKNNQYALVRDILSRVGMRQGIKNNASFFIEYDYQDGDTPDNIADRLYGDSNLHWLVMMINDVINPWYDFPLSQRKLEAYLKKKYPGVALFVSIPTVETDESYLTFEQGNLVDIEGTIATVWKWDKTYRKLEVYIPEDDNAEPLFSAINVTDIIQPAIEFIYVLGDPDNFEIVDENNYRIGWLADEESLTGTVVAKQRNIDAVHHFEEDGLYLEPNASVSALIDSYINSLLGLNNEPTETVTNFEYEQAENEDKRSLKLLRPDFVDLVVRELEELLA
jgi:hypothetical protein